MAQMTTTVTGSFSLVTLHRTGKLALRCFAYEFHVNFRSIVRSFLQANSSNYQRVDHFKHGTQLDKLPLPLRQQFKESSAKLAQGWHMLAEIHCGTPAAVNVYLYPPRR